AMKIGIRPVNNAKALAGWVPVFFFNKDRPTNPATTIFDAYTAMIQHAMPARPSGKPINVIAAIRAAAGGATSARKPDPAASAKSRVLSKSTRERAGKIQNRTRPD